MQSGGVIRRRKADVEREIGLARLELAVRRRGFHLVEAGHQVVIICDPRDVRLIC
ncbi:hypothetical protein [Nioella nitratireducens]|uniref:hypothetical protein n=1 Tax=Nioella nitratireducens TaxID=1287720 RepID=UPI0013144696|nr:hypothetical protein [Nioella nitratireducens]